MRLLPFLSSLCFESPENQPPAKNNYNETCIKLVRAGLSVGADDRKKAGEQQKASERKTAAKNHFPSFLEMKIRAS